MHQVIQIGKHRLWLQAHYLLHLRITEERWIPLPAESNSPSRGRSASVPRRFGAGGTLVLQTVIVAVHARFDVLEVQLALERERVDRLAAELDGDFLDIVLLGALIVYH